eukprot:5558-Heterococcus_DN1.PRE.4
MQRPLLLLVRRQWSTHCYAAVTAPTAAIAARGARASTVTQYQRSCCSHSLDPAGSCVSEYCFSIDYATSILSSDESCCYRMRVIVACTNSLQGVLPLENGSAAQSATVSSSAQTLLSTSQRLHRHITLTHQLVDSTVCRGLAIAEIAARPDLTQHLTHRESLSESRPAAHTANIAASESACVQLVVTANTAYTAENTSYCSHPASSVHVSSNMSSGRASYEMKVMRLSVLLCSSSSSSDALCVVHSVRCSYGVTTACKKIIAASCKLKRASCESSCRMIDLSAGAARRFAQPSALVQCVRTDSRPHHALAMVSVYTTGGGGPVASSNLLQQLVDSSGCRGLTIAQTAAILYLMQHRTNHELLLQKRPAAHTASCSCPCKRCYRQVSVAYTRHTGLHTMMLQHFSNALRRTAAVY